MDPNKTFDCPAPQKTPKNVIKQTSETAFENTIESLLLASGFECHHSPDFNCEQALFFFKPAHSLKADLEVSSKIMGLTDPQTPAI